MQINSLMLFLMTHLLLTTGTLEIMNELVIPQFDR